MAFDRLIYIDRLKQAGMDEGLARAHADALRDALLETVATKADLADLRNELKAEIGDVRFEAKELRHEMQTEFKAVRVEVNDLRHEMQAEFKALRIEIQLSQRDLMPKGAAALVVLASVLIGVKFLG